VEVQRLDFGRLGKVERTPQGGIRVPANLTRIGVFPYTRPDGTVVRELRHPEEVFAADSLATLAGAPVTDLHPAQPVRPNNWRDLTIGHVGDAVKNDGRFVSANLSIQDAAAIDAVDRGDRIETSCGYSCRLDASPGTYEGAPYDAVQRSIRYNHVAIGPKNWGRAGNEVALRLDDNGNQTTAATPPAKEDRMRYTIDGVAYDTASPEFMQALALRDKRTDEIAATLRAERDTASAERDAANKSRDDAAAKLAAAEDPKRLDALVAERVKLVDNARRVLGTEAKFDGKTDREIMIETIRKDDATFDGAAKSDDYVRAYFEASTKSTRRHDEGGTGIGAARSATVNAVRTHEEKKTDAVDRNDAAGARARMLADNAAAASNPLRFSRTA
jgi:hypothetical protein